MIRENSAKRNLLPREQTPLKNCVNTAFSDNWANQSLESLLLFGIVLKAGRRRRRVRTLEIIIIIKTKQTKARQRNCVRMTTRRYRTRQKSHRQHHSQLLSSSQIFNTKPFSPIDLMPTWPDSYSFILLGVSIFRPLQIVRSFIWRCPGQLSLLRSLMGLYLFFAFFAFWNCSTDISVVLVYL